jgi:hypothetical protein
MDFQYVIDMKVPTAGNWWQGAKEEKGASRIKTKMAKGEGTLRV